MEVLPAAILFDLDDTILSFGSRQQSLTLVAEKYKAELGSMTPEKAGCEIERAFVEFWADEVRHKAWRFNLLDSRILIVSEIFAAWREFAPALTPEVAKEFATEFNDRLSALGIDKFGIVGAEYLKGAASLESDEDLIALYEAELNNFGKLLLVADKMTTEYGSNADINFLVDLDKVSQLVDVILDANFRRNGGINKIVELQANLEERHQTLGDYADTADELENLGYEGTDLVEKLNAVVTGIPAIKATLESGLLQTKEQLERFLSAKPTDTPKAMLKR